MIGSRTPKAIADTRRFIDASNKALNSFSPEQRNEYKACLERHGSPMLTATALLHLLDDLPVAADFAVPEETNF
jgi:hypothetical protein